MYIYVPNIRRCCTSKTEDNIDEIRRHIECDRHFTMSEISEKIRISYGRTSVEWNCNLQKFLYVERSNCRMDLRTKLHPII